MPDATPIPDPATAPDGTVLFEAEVPDRLRHPLMDRVRVVMTNCGTMAQSVATGCDGREFFGYSGAVDRITLRALLDALRAEQAARIAAEARVAELETPDMFWNRDDPERPSDSMAEMVTFEGMPIGGELRVLRARSLPEAAYRVTPDDDDPEYPGDAELIAVEGTPEFAAWLEANPNA